MTVCGGPQAGAALCGCRDKMEKKLLGAAGTDNMDHSGEDDEGPTLWYDSALGAGRQAGWRRARGRVSVSVGLRCAVSPPGANAGPSGEANAREDGSGKTTLMAKLQGVEYNKKGRGLEYLYLNVHDEDRDDLTRCNVWILDGDLYHKGLLKFAVSGDSLEDSLAMFVVDMSRPWAIMESLEKWTSVLREHVDKLKMPPEKMKELEQTMVKAFQEYVEPEEAVPPSPQRRGPPAGTEDEGVLLPLGENVLTHNLGIPVLVVCTKCDAVTVLEKELDYKEEHFDFIQSHVRRFCLQCILQAAYGAALIYTSVKEEKNLDLLYKYIVHKLFDFQFTTAALVVEKDAVFIPSGWDNEKKIAILHENFTTVRPDDLFKDFITTPPVRKLVHDKEINAEDEQVFLMKQQSLLAKQPATPTRGTESPARTTSGSPRPTGRPVPTNVASVSPMTTVKKPDPNMKGAAANEGVLANFFNSLLSKKTGAPGSPGSAGTGVPGSTKKTGQKPALTDVQAELDRMTHKSDSIVTANDTPESEHDAGAH
ncbi:hypothetical protein P4O66_021768 [Electrophorus voltai]|uniref:Dynein light intermediate chain n=1 Tax=Electrophorus voltai TaxID=2609070 RepID=A0AAD8ZPM2_9TELE|nr:hypothetical protein P4O66_021768 [Electrophorus voltai]